MLENMLDYLRIALYALLLVAGFVLFQAWDKEHPKILSNTPAAIEQQAQPTGRFIPNIAPASGTVSTPAPAVTNSPVLTTPESGKIVTVKTDLMEVSIDTHGGDVVGVKLLKYPESLNSKTPFVLLNDDEQTRYVAESGILSQQGPDTQASEAIYTVSQDAYSLDPNQKTLTVNLEWQNQDGLKVTKSFTFNKDSYEINVGYLINNQTSQPWQGSAYSQLMRTNSPPVTHGGIVNLTTFFGAAISSPQKPFEKITFKQMQQQGMQQTITGGWAAMVQHYFISAWVPDKDAVSTYYTRVTPSGLYTVGLMGQTLTAKPGETVKTSAKLYAGPAIADRLEKTAPGLPLTIDYGWFWFISVIIFWMMQKIHSVVGNWGWSIVLVTVIIKLMFYQLSAKSYRSMSGLKRLQPRIEKLKEKYGDDRQKLTQATMELYKEEKVNPLSGCLPILIQIPVFIALYWVLVESVQLRQAPFILWIHDLSVQDPYYVLPALMALSMFVQQRLNPPPPDPMQAKMMMAMPFIFAFLFARFPAGLMLYWFVNNTLSVLQQWHIMRKIDKSSYVKK
jgi:YidC/Oxa1 family membrane protein insertase